MPMKKDLPTVAQLARAAGVSPATVSRVLNHKGIVKADTYNRVVAVLQANGYPFVEKAGRADPSDVLMISLPSLDNPFYADIVRGQNPAQHAMAIILSSTKAISTTTPCPQFWSWCAACASPGLLQRTISLQISCTR